MSVPDGPLRTERGTERSTGRDYVRLMRHLRPYRRKLGISIAAAVVVAFTLPATPLFVRAAIDGPIPEGAFGTLGWMLGGMLVLALVKALSHGVRRQTSGEVAVAVEADLRQHLYEHVQALDFGYHERVPTGQIMSRASSDIQAIRQYLMTVPFSLTMILQALVIFGVMFVLEPGLAALFAVTGPLLGLTTYRFASKFDPVVWRMQQKLGDFAAVAEETISGIRVVKAFGRENHQLDQLGEEAEGVYDASMDTIRLRATFVPLYYLVPLLGVAGVLYFGGRSVIEGTSSEGTVVALFAYLFMLLLPLRALGMVVAWAQRAVTASGRIFEILDTEPGIADRPGATDLEITEGTVRFEGVHFGYPGGDPVLRGVDLEVPAGRSLALVGPTGCGKSTLIRILCRFVEPTDGRVTIDGQDIADVTLDSLRARLGIVFEDTLLFSDTVAGNIAFGRPDATEEDIVRAAVTAQAHDFVAAMPDGYTTMVGEQGYTLSGGQRQRIAIARAVLMDPRILILDDATSNVDARVEAAIRRGLQDAMAGRTTLIVARRPSTAALADRVAYMEDGRIVEAGTHAELWRSLSAYRETLLTGDEDAARVVDADVAPEAAG